MSDQHKILIGSFKKVIVMRLGDDGYNEFVPATVSIYIMPSNNFKVWIIARAASNKNLIFNAIIPKNMAIATSEKEKMVISFGKVPSTTYTDERSGKPIPTFWKFCVATEDDKSGLLFFLNAARKNFDVPSNAAKIFMTHTKKPLRKKNMKKMKNVSAVKGSTIEAKKLPPKKPSLTIDLCEVEKEKENEVNKYGFDSDDEFGTLSDIESPQFAQSQDVYASMSHWNNKYN